MMSKKDAKKKVSLLMIAVLLLFGAVGLVAAKYIQETGGDGLFFARDFYFSSNLLTEKGEKYTLSTDAGSVSFTLGNNADELRFTEENVYYEVTVTGKDAGGNPLAADALPEPDSVKGQIAPNLIDHEPTSVTITMSGLKTGETYTVEAEGYTKNGDTKVYSKTLKATFTISDEQTLYKHLQKDPGGSYVILTVWSKNVKGTVTIAAIPAGAISDISGLIPDSTDSILKDVKNYQSGVYQPLSGSFAIKDTTNFTNTYSGKTYRFFLDDSNPSLKNLTVNNFDVSIGAYIAAPDTP